MIINNLTHREIIFIRFQSNKTLFSGSLTLIPPLEPIRNLLQICNKFRNKGSFDSIPAFSNTVFIFSL